MTKNIEEVSLYDVMSNNMAIYGAYVNLHRSIPDIRDGLKPVQRRIVYGMYESDYTHNKPYHKSAKIVGNVMGSYHPHGDSSIYEAMVLLGQPWATNALLVDGQGNYGSIEGDSAGAMRYTEARLHKITQLLTQGLNKNAVDMIDNYDGSQKEPRVLPAAFPVALVNGTIGIGWSQASKIIPHNPNELLKATKAILKNPEIDATKIASYIKGPDLPGGADVIVDKAELLNEINTGSAKYIMRATIDVIDDPKKPRLEVKNIPHNTSADDTNINKLIDVLNEASVFGVEGFENDIKGSIISLIIKCKAGTSKEKLEQLKAYLYKNTFLESKITVNNNLIDKGKPRVLGIKRQLIKFLEYRKETLIRIWQFDIDKLNRRKEIVEGLLQLKDVLNEVINLARQAESRKDLIEQLHTGLRFTQRQAEHIADLKMYQLSKQDFNALTEEHSSIEKKSNELHLWISDPEATKVKLEEDLDNTLSVFKDLKRRSKIIDASTVVEEKPIKLTELVEAKKTKVIVKRDLQIFQLGQVAYRNQIDKYTDNDIVAAYDAMTTDYVVAITKDGKAVTRFVNDLPTTSLDGKVKRINEEITDLKASNEFVGAVVGTKESTEKFLMVSKGGAIKVGYVGTLMPNTSTKRYIKLLSKAAGLKFDSDELVYANMVEPSTFDQQLHVTLKDMSRKTNKVVRKVELNKFKDRDDSAGNSGTTGFNTKKGQLPFISMEFVTTENK